MSERMSGRMDSVAPVARPEKMRLTKWPWNEVLVPAVTFVIKAMTTASKKTGRRPNTKESGKRPRHPNAITMVGYVDRPVISSGDFSGEYSWYSVFMNVPVPESERMEKIAISSISHSRVINRRG